MRLSHGASPDDASELAKILWRVFHCDYYVSFSFSASVLNLFKTLWISYSKGVDFARISSGFIRILMLFFFHDIDLYSD